MWGSPESHYTSDRKASPEFVTALKRYDQLLYVRWNNARHRFEIWREVRKGVWGKRGVHVMPVRYPQLDSRILADLASCDLIRYAQRPHGRIADFERDMDNYNDHVAVARELQAERDCEGIARQELWPAARRLFGTPKSRALWTTGGKALS